MSNSTLKMMRDAGRISNAVMRQADSIGRCVKHFCPIGETSGDTISDIVGSPVMTSAGNFTWDSALGSAQLNGQTFPIALASGEFVDINDKDFIYLVVGTTADDATYPDSHLCQLGKVGSLSSGFSVSQAKGNISDSSGNVAISTPALDTTLTNGLSVSMASIGDRSGNMTYRVGGDSSQSKSVDITAISGFTPDAFFISLGIKLQGLALFTFEDGLPSDYAAGIDWMYNDWSSKTDGDLRLIYPPWVSLK